MKERTEDKIGKMFEGRKCPPAEAVVRKFKPKKEPAPEDREAEKRFIASWGLDPEDWFIRKKHKKHVTVQNSVTGEIRTITEPFEGE